MFQSSTTAFALLVISLSLLLSISQTLADHNKHEQHCDSDNDCGSGAICKRGLCECSNKDHVFVPEAESHCQMIGTINGICKYDLQCTKRDTLSRCHDSKCECYDTVNKRDVVKEYKGTCYPATAVDAPCNDDNQCRAFVAPEEHVKCYHNHTENAVYCRCDDGVKCEHKSNAQSVQVNYFATLSLVGFMALKTML